MPAYFSVFIWELINIVFVSIPEELFFILLSLMLMRRFDLLKLEGKNTFKLVFLVVFLAVLTNLVSAQNLIDINYRAISTSFAAFISMAAVYRITKLNEIINLFICIILSATCILLIQFPYYSVLLYLTGRTSEYISTVGMQVLLVTIPERIIEGLIILLIIFKRKSFLQINIIKLIMKDRVLLIISIACILFNILLLMVVGNFVIIDKILINKDFGVQISAIISIFFVPLINITIVWLIIYNIKSKESFEKMLSRERIKTLTSILEYHAKTGNYQKLDGVITDINRQANKLYEET